jgi:hypothetical protein
MDLGMRMMMKNLGFDPEKIMSDFNALTEGVKKTLADINKRLEGIEKVQAEILSLQREVTAWKRQQKTAELLQLPPQPPQPAPNQPQQPPL